MKCVIVSSSAIAKYKRLDAAFYCGTLGKEHREKIDSLTAEIAAKQAKVHESEALEQRANANHCVALGVILPAWFYCRAGFIAANAISRTRFASTQFRHGQSKNTKKRKANREN
jgi:hypothetical protein